MTRFEILKLLSDAFFGATCSQLAKMSGQKHWNTRSFRASLATRLRRLRSSSLIRRELDRWSRPAHSRRIGIYRWWITQRGQERLAWAKSKGLV
jgi:hypothetical protein